MKPNEKTESAKAVRCSALVRLLHRISARLEHPPGSVSEVKCYGGSTTQSTRLLLAILALKESAKHFRQAVLWLREALVMTAYSARRVAKVYHAMLMTSLGLGRPRAGFESEMFSYTDLPNSVNMRTHLFGYHSEKQTHSTAG